MKTITTTITQRGQVTIPAQVRRILRVQPRDKVTFEIENDNTVKITQVPFALRAVFGSVKPTRRSENFKKLSREAREEHIDKVIRKFSAQ